VKNADAFAALAADDFHVRRLSARYVCALLLVCVLLLPVTGAQGATWQEGGVAAWGCNGVTTRVCTPGGLFGVVDIGAGTDHGLALNVGGSVIFTWGCDSGLDFGQCGPQLGLSDVVAVAAGDAHSLALKKDGTVLAWGCGAPHDYGQCAVPAGLTAVTAIAAGTSQSLALKSDGSVVAWGCSGDDYGQCSVPVGVSNVTAVAAGDVHSLALRSDGTVVAWGCGAPYDHGQCGVPAGLSNVVAIAAGTSQSLAVMRDGSVVAWGCSGDDYGQCAVPTGLSGVLDVAAGDVHSLALKSDGSVVAWGCGAPYDYGQCNVPAGMPAVADIAASVIDSLVRFKRTQTVSVAPITGTFRVTGPDAVVTATTTSKLQAVFETTGGCVVTGATMSLPGQTKATLHITGAGTCTITASQPGDRDYTAAPPVARTITIAKGDQTISFHPPADATFGDADITISATASSGLPVSFAAEGSCTLSGVTVHIVGAGVCDLTASQPGDSNYNAAPDVSKGLRVAKAAQRIRFAPLHKRFLGTRDFKVSASASSGLPVSFAAHGSCRIRGKTVHLTAAGTCAIVASQRGDRNREPAKSVTRKFAIAPARCTVPNVVGKPLANAKAAVTRAHCGVGAVRSTASKRPQNTVVSQSRRSGKKLPHGTKIGLVVSRGR
jgi:PASTA domain/Regulator of chromosome condensation (RCC1) repeat